MKITYTVGARAGLTAEVDDETGAWMVSKRRAVEVPAVLPPDEGTEAPRVKRKYVRKVSTEGTTDKGTEAQ